MLSGPSKGEGQGSRRARPRGPTGPTGNRPSQISKAILRRLDFTLTVTGL